MVVAPGSDVVTEQRVTNRFEKIAPRDIRPLQSEQRSGGRIAPLDPTAFVEHHGGIGKRLRGLDEPVLEAVEAPPPLAALTLEAQDGAEHRSPRPGRGRGQLPTVLEMSRQSVE